MAKFTRREFIKISGGALLGFAGSGLVLGSHGIGATPAYDPGTTPDRIVPTIAGSASGIAAYWSMSKMRRLSRSRATRTTPSPMEGFAQGEPAAAVSSTTLTVSRNRSYARGTGRNKSSRKSAGMRPLTIPP